MSELRLLQINCVYGEGSTGRIVADIQGYCRCHGIPSLSLFGRGGFTRNENDVVKVSSETEAKVHSVLSRCTGLDFAYSPLATNEIIKRLEDFVPTVVHLHCLNGHFVNVYRLLDYLKRNKIKTILTLHAELMYTAGCEHAYDCMKWTSECCDCQRIRGAITHWFRDDAKKAFNLMQKAFTEFDNLTIVGVSEWLTDRARQSGIFRHCTPMFTTVHNGCDLSEFKDLHLPASTRNPVILHVTPDFRHPLKGGKYVLELSRLHPEWQFIIVGYNGDDSIQVPENVRIFPKTHSKKELASLFCGTPVVGFKAGGPESVFNGDFASFVKYGDLKALSEAVQKMLNSAIEIDTEYIASRFSSSQMAENYMEIYK